MSGISVSNILPSRTRSGTRRQKEERQTPCKPPQTAAVDFGETRPKEADPFDFAKPQVQPEVVQAKPQAKAEDVRVYLSKKALELYTNQLKYVMSPGNREGKFSLMSDYQALAASIKEALGTRAHSAESIDEVAKWVELLCWQTRISVFHQSVCVA